MNAVANNARRRTTHDYPNDLGRVGNSGLVLKSLGHLEEVSAFVEKEMVTAEYCAKSQFLDKDCFGGNHETA